MTAALLVLHVRFEPLPGSAWANGARGKWNARVKLPATQDSFRVLAALDGMWPQLVAVAGARPGGFRLRMVGVTLTHLAAVGGEQRSLFERLDPDHELARSLRTEALSRAMDRINTRFGQNAVMLGPQNGGRADRIGTSIAFGRIPDAAEFTA
jgi:DNA polymerase-4